MKYQDAKIGMEVVVHEDAEKPFLATVLDRQEVEEQLLVGWTDKATCARVCVWIDCLDCYDHEKAKEIAEFERQYEISSGGQG
jgi:hypothetical protein